MNSRLPGYAFLVIAFVSGFVIAGCSGCATRSIGKIELPDISASSITYKRSDPAGGTVITAKKVVDHGAFVTAEQLNLTTIYPSFSVSIDVQDYRRDKPTSPPAPAPSTAPSTAPLPAAVFEIPPGAFVPKPREKTVELGTRDLVYHPSDFGVTTTGIALPHIDGTLLETR